MRVLVTGGCGFVGAAVVRLAVERGDNVLNIDRKRKNAPCPALGQVNGKPGYVRLEADVSDRMMMRAVFREFKPEAVIHLVASGDEKDDAKIYDAEVGGLFAVLEASRAQMASLQGEQRQKFRIVLAQRAELEPVTKMTPREAARVTQAQLLSSWSQAHDLPIVTCIAGDVFGPWETQPSFLSQLIMPLMRGGRGVLKNGGETVRDWLPVRDFADGLLCAAQHADPKSIVEFSAGAERRDIDLAEALCSLLDIRVPLPNGQSWTSMIDITGDPSTGSQGPMLDDGEAEAMLNWRPRGFHAGLDRILSWGITHYAPPKLEVAKAEAPKAEAPRAEAPKDEAPDAEVPPRLPVAAE